MLIQSFMSKDIHSILSLWPMIFCSMFFTRFFLMSSSILRKVQQELPLRRSVKNLSSIFSHFLKTKNSLKIWLKKPPFLLHIEQFLMHFCQAMMNSKLFLKRGKMVSIDQILLSRIQSLNEKWLTTNSKSTLESDLNRFSSKFLPNIKVHWDKLGLKSGKQRVLMD